VNLFRKMALRLAAMDWLLTVGMLCLVATGIAFVYSASQTGDEASRALHHRQIVWAAVGLVAYTGMALANYRDLERIAPFAYAVAVVLLVVVLFAGARIYGAQRWLFIGGLGIQPSEAAKFATLVFLASVLGHPSLEVRSSLAIAVSLAIAGLPILLILKQPDLGTAMVFVPMAMGMMFVAGIRARVLAVFGAAGAVLVSLMIAAVVLPGKLDLDAETQERIWQVTGLSDYQRTRIRVFLQPEYDPLGAGWSRRQSEIAVGSGGTWGKGFRKGTQNILGFVPRSVAHTDFIFSVIAEEKGFFGAVCLLGLYGLVVWRTAAAAYRASDTFGRLLCVGVALVLFLHVFINVGMTIGTMPVTGLPLPLVSYGGSFAVVAMTLLGIVQSVHMRSLPRREGVFFRDLPTRADVLK